MLLNKWLFQTFLTLSIIQVSICMDEDGDLFDQMINEDIDSSDWLDPFSMGFDETDLDTKKSCQADCRKEQDKLELRTRELIQCQEAYGKMEEEMKKAERAKNQQPKPVLKSSKDDSKVVQNCTCDTKPVPEAPVFREIYLQRFVSYLVNRLDLRLSDDAHLNLEIKLSQSKIKTLHKFRNEKVELYEVDQILTEMIQHVAQHQPTSRLNAFKEFMAEIRDPLMDASMALALALAVIFTFRYFPLWKLVLVIVILSVFWHWLHMYKNEWAIKKSKMMQTRNIPPECRKEDMSWIESSFYYFKSSSSLTDPCEEYHKTLLVDPIYDVNPLMALADLASKIVLRPMRNFATEFAEAYKSLLKDIPWQYQVLLLPLFSVILLLVLILVFRYSIRLPLGFEISPQSSANLSLAENIKDIKKQLEFNSRLQSEGGYLAQHRNFIEAHDIHQYKIASGQIQQQDLRYVSGAGADLGSGAGAELGAGARSEIGSGGHDDYDGSKSGNSLQYNSATFTALQQDWLFARQMSEPVLSSKTTDQEPVSSKTADQKSDLAKRKSKHAKRRLHKDQIGTVVKGADEEKDVNEKGEKDDSIDKHVPSTISLHEDKIQSINHVKVSELSTIGEHNLETSGASEYTLETSLDDSNFETNEASKHTLESSLEDSNFETYEASKHILESSLEATNLETNEASEYTLESSNLDASEPSEYTVEASICDATGEDKIAISVNENLGSSTSRAATEQGEDGVVPDCNRDRDDSLPHNNRDRDDSFRESGDTILSPSAKKFLEKVKDVLEP